MPNIFLNDKKKTGSNSEKFTFNRASIMIPSFNFTNEWGDLHGVLGL